MYAQFQKKEGAMKSKDSPCTTEAVANPDHVRLFEQVGKGKANQGEWRYFDPKHDDFEAAMKRIYQATNAKNQTELACILGISQSSISDAKSRRSIPAEWFLKLYELLEINPEWIKRGGECRYIQLAQ